MAEQRKNTRYKAEARARVRGVFESGALLKDLSVTGCNIVSTVPIDLKQGAEYTIEIVPESASNIKSFELKAEARWIRTQNHLYEAGFMITVSPSKKEFEHYIDYLAFRNETA